VGCCPRKPHSFATTRTSDVLVFAHFRLSPYPRPPSGVHFMQNLAAVWARPLGDGGIDRGLMQPAPKRNTRRPAKLLKPASVTFPSAIYDA
jgi:hypothetical protein